MPAVTIDASVVDGSNTLPFPNPIYPIQNPTLFGPELVGAIDAPFDIGAISAAVIGSPVLFGSQSIGSIDSPIIVNAESISAIDAPVLVSSLADTSIANPVNITAESISTIDLPVNITAESESVLSAPVPATPNALDPELPPFALNHARILYENLLVGSIVTVNQGINPNYTLIPNTAQRWTATLTGVTAAIEYLLPANTNIDTICIGSHNISSVGGDFEILYHPADTGVFIQISPDITPINNNSIMIHLGSAVSARRLQIKIKNANGSFYIGSVYAGIALQMQRPFFGGHTPAVLARQADYYSSMSESGNFIGVEVRRRALESSAAWKNITDTWYRTYFVPFLASAEILPFYFAWNLLQYPTDVAYCKNITNIAPSYSGQRDLMSVDIPLIGIA